MIKAIVTGGAGFIGSNLVDALIDKGYEVTVMDNLLTGTLENIHSKAKFVNIDISYTSNLYEMAFLMTHAEFVFHTAALARVQPSIKDPIWYNMQNTSGTLNVLQAAYKAGVKRVLYSASSSAYGATNTMPLTEDMPADPLSPYGLQKVIGEQYCRLFSKIYGLETVSLRYFNVYGERQPASLVMDIFAECRRKHLPLPVTNNGEQRRDFTYVQDVVQANILAAHSLKVGTGEVINIGNGKNTSINELAKMFGGEIAYTGPVLEPAETLACIAKAKELLGWEPKGNLQEWVKQYKLNHAI